MLSQILTLIRPDMEVWWWITSLISLKVQVRLHRNDQRFAPPSHHIEPDRYEILNENSLYLNYCALQFLSLLESI